MGQFQSKDPDATLDYATDWTAWLAAGETIATSTWIMPTVPDSALIQDDYNHTTTTATIWLRGGTLDATYTIVNRIVTNQGRTEDRSKFITITQH